MRYISLFSGVEAATLAWEPLGWEAVAFAEIEPFPSAVLAERWPDVPNLGDVTKVDWSKYRGAVDVVVGGSPCQAFSVAGKREGLMDTRGQLMLEYVRAVAEVRPRWFLWENVPGVLSQDRGRAFGTLLREMDELGYGMAWRVLDAQFFGVAQRRRRVFLVGHLGGGAGPAAAVLFESESVSGDTPSSKQKREALAADARSRAQGAGECLTPWDVQSKRVYSPDACGPTLNRGAGMTTTPSVLAFAQKPAVSFQTGHTSGNGCGFNTEDVSYTISTSVDTAIAEPIAMASGQAHAEIGAGGGGSDADGTARGAVTSNGSDVFPSLCATDGSKQFIDNQSVNSGRLLLDPRREWV